MRSRICCVRQSTTSKGAYRLNVSSIVYRLRRTLAECLRSEDKHSFAHMFNTFQAACEQLPDLSLVESFDPELGPNSTEALSGSFLDVISHSSRETTIKLLMRLRYDKHFVADRIASLSHKELTSMLSDGTSSRRAESVLGGWPSGIREKGWWRPTDIHVTGHLVLPG